MVDFRVDQVELAVLFTPDHVVPRLDLIPDHTVEVFVFTLPQAVEMVDFKFVQVVPAVVFGGMMTLGIVGVTAVASPKFRELDIEKDLETI